MKTQTLPKDPAYFKDIIWPIIIDKLIIGLIVAVTIVLLNKWLERFKGEQAKMLEYLKSEQSVKKDYETLRDKTALLHLQRQIEELYSPLLGLIQYSINIFEIFYRKKASLNEGEKAGLERYFDEKYFLPINLQIATLIRSKIYLIEGDVLPDSFNDVLIHEAQFACQYNLWKEKNISSDEIKGEGWPMNLEKDVAETLKKLRIQYNDYRKHIISFQPTSKMEG